MYDFPLLLQILLNKMKHLTLHNIFVCMEMYNNKYLLYFVIIW